MECADPLSYPETPVDAHVEFATSRKEVSIVAPIRVEAVSQGFATSNLLGTMSLFCDPSDSLGVNGKPS
jgi:hypothetical protein